MTDRELLELAAKAVGYEIRWNDWRDYGSHTRYFNETTGGYWNSLFDDAQTLRLSVLLSVDISHNDCQDNNLYVCVHRKGIEMCYGPIKIIEEFEDEKHRLYATRRAIVRAAAEIGKEIKNERTDNY